MEGGARKKVINTEDMLNVSITMHGAKQCPAVLLDLQHAVKPDICSSPSFLSEHIFFFRKGMCVEEYKKKDSVCPFYLLSRPLLQFVVIPSNHTHAHSKTVPSLHCIDSHAFYYIIYIYLGGSSSECLLIYKYNFPTIFLPFFLKDPARSELIKFIVYCNAANQPF